MTKHSFWQSCHNWKVIIPIAVAVLIAWFFFRDQWNINALWPIAFLLLCPLSMVFMMKSMNHSHCSEEHKDASKNNSSSDETNQKNV